MSISTDFPQQAISALNHLQASHSITKMAADMGVPVRWLHQAKTNRHGVNTVLRYIQVFNYLSQHGLLDNDTKTINPPLADTPSACGMLGDKDTNPPASSLCSAGVGDSQMKGFDNLGDKGL